ncbi:MAG: hypothetical protein ACK2T3_13385, partial [Candidatus Promineifilaceae bacterium]
MRGLVFLICLSAFTAAGCRNSPRDQIQPSQNDWGEYLQFEGPRPSSAEARLGKGAANVMAVAEDGGSFVVGGDTGLTIYSVDPPEELWSVSTSNPVISLSISPDGSLLAAGLDEGSALLV